MSRLECAQIELHVPQSAHWNKRFTWRIGAPGAAAAPVNLTGCQIDMQIRETPESAQPLVSLSTTDASIAIVDALQGVFELRFTPEQTDGLILGNGWYDVRVTFANGDVLRPVRGRVRLLPGVTR